MRIFSHTFKSFSMAPKMIIGISGASNSGKTSLCEALEASFPGSHVIHQDEFFHDEDYPGHIWVDLGDNVKHQNWEILASIDFDALNKQIINDYNNRDFGEDGLLIVEGHIIFDYKDYLLPFDRKYLITLSKEVCYARRLKRSYIPPDKPGYFDQTVWPEYCRYLEEMKTHNGLIYLNGEDDPKRNLEIVIQTLSNTSV